MLPVPLYPGEKKKKKKTRVWAYCMLNVPPSAGFCVRGTPQAAGWNSNLAIQMHLDLRQNLATGDDIFQPVYAKPAEPLCSELILCFCFVAPKTKGIEIGALCFFFFGRLGSSSELTHVHHE